MAKKDERFVKMLDEGCWTVTASLSSPAFPFPNNRYIQKEHPI